MKKSLFGSYTFLALLIVLVFALSGAVSVVLTQRYGLKIDLTENQLYTLSDETREIVSALDQPVTLTVLNTQQEFPLLTRSLLERYPLLSDNLSVVYCDPYRQPQKVAGYAQMGYQVEQDDIMIEAGGQVRQLKLSDLYELSGDGATVERLVAEQRITSAIDQVTKKKRAPVLFVDGHGETPSTSLMELFEMNQYAVQYTTISVLGVDPNAALLVICAPERDFSEADIDALEAYLSDGGSVMVFAEPGTQQLSNLNAFLREWGVGLTGDTVHEPNLYVNGSDAAVAASYAQHEINAYFANNRLFVIAPSCAALEQTYIRQGAVRTQQVLTSTADAIAGDVEKRQGPFPLAMTARRTDAATGGERGRMFVAGSKLVYGDDLLNTPSVANRDFLTQAIAWCDGTPDLISVPAREMGDRFLPIVAGDAQRLAVLLTGVLPALVLALGVAVWLRRRYL